MPSNCIYFYEIKNIWYIRRHLFLNNVKGFKGYPVDSRPRERMENHGAKALANHELLAILLRTGIRNKSVIELAFQVLGMFDSLHMFRYATLEELVTVPGIGKAKAIELLAAIEFGMRVSKSSQIKAGTVVSSQWIGEFLKEEIGGLMQENVVAVYLNTKNEIIKKEIVFTGTLNSAVAHPREIFRAGVRYSAARIIIGHNHPSGNPEPSEADYQFTKRMVRAGEIIGIELLDHIIVGENKYISLKEEGFF